MSERMQPVQIEAEQDGTRRLVGGSVWWRMDRQISLVFKARKNDGSIFDEPVAKAMQGLESNVRSSQKWKELCNNEWKEGGQKPKVDKTGCSVGESFTNFLFPSTQWLGESVAKETGVSRQLTFDGRGHEQTPGTAVISYLQKQAPDLLKRLLPSDAGTSNDLEVSRTTYFFQLPFRAAAGSSTFNDKKAEVESLWLQFLFDEFYPIVRDFESEHVLVYWQADGLSAHELEDVLFLDALYAIGSVIFAFCYLSIYLTDFRKGEKKIVSMTSGILLALTSILVVVMSVPFTYVLYSLFVGDAPFHVMNFLAIYMIFSVGCYFTIQFVDGFKNVQGATKKERLRLLYIRIGESCLYVAVTTSGCFLASLFLSVRPLREVGLFTALGTIVVLVFVAYFIPPLMLTTAKFEDGLREVFGAVNSSSGSSSSSSLEFTGALPESSSEPVLETETRTHSSRFVTFLTGPFVSRVDKNKKTITVCFTTLFVAALVGTIFGATGSRMLDVNAFPEEHNLNAGRELVNTFSEVGARLVDVPITGEVCFAGQASEACVYHWCDSESHIDIDHNAENELREDCECQFRKDSCRYVDAYSEDDTFTVRGYFTGFDADDSRVDIERLVDRFGTYALQQGEVISLAASDTDHNAYDLIFQENLNFKITNAWLKNYKCRGQPGQVVEMYFFSDAGRCVRSYAPPTK